MSFPPSAILFPYLASLRSVGYAILLIRVVCAQSHLLPRLKPLQSILAVRFDCLVAVRTKCEAPRNIPSLCNAFALDDVNYGVYALDRIAFLRPTICCGG